MEDGVGEEELGAVPGQPCSKQLPPAALIALLESFRVGSSKQIRRASSSPRAVPCAICPLQTHPSRAASPRSSWAAACAWLHGTELGRERTTSPPQPRTHPSHPPPCSPAHPYKSRSGMPPPLRRGLGVTCDPWQMVRGRPALRQELLQPPSVGQLPSQRCRPSEQHPHPGTPGCCRRVGGARGV